MLRCSRVLLPSSSTTRRSSFAKEIANIKEEQANAQAAMEVAQTKLTEAQSSLMAAQNEAKQANDTRQAAVQELKIAVDDNDTKAAKIDNLMTEVTTKTPSESDALAAKKEARDAASALNDEVGLLRSQPTASSRKEQASTALYNETATRLKHLESLNIENGKDLSEMARSPASSQAANKEQEDWQPDKIVQQAGPAKKLEDTKDQPADEIANSKKAPAAGVPMRKHVTTLVTVLTGGRTTDWAARTKALSELREMVAAAVTADAPLAQMCKWVAAFLVPLQIQLTESRSSVFKDTCSTVVAIVEALGTLYDASAVTMLPMLYEHSGSTTGVMSSSAAVSCMMTIMTHCRGEGLCFAAVMTQAMEYKGAGIRAHCMSVVAEAIATWTEEELSAHLSALCSGLQTAKQDSNNGVRMYARK